MSDRNGNNKIVKLSTDLDSLASYHGRHSYRVFKNLVMENDNLGRTLLNNCNLQNCFIKNCKMDSVDFQGTEFFCCTFENVSFHGADIASCIFRNCSFDKCSFDAINFFDNNIVNSQIKDCKFNVSTINNNIWDKCEFIEFRPEDTSIYSNEFSYCLFTNSSLLSAIYYTIFDKCKFIDSEIDSYILGFQFGLLPKDLRTLNIVHFGEKNVTIGYIKDKLFKIYQERQMRIEAKILNMIFANNTGVEIEELVNLLFNELDCGYTIKVDEARFIRKILSHIYKTNRISLFYYLFIIYNISKNNILEYRKTLSDNLYNEISILYQFIFSIKMDLEKVYIEISNIFLSNIKYLEKAKIEFIYTCRPSYRVYEIINESSSHNISPILEFEGCFHEIYEFVIENLHYFAALVTITGVNLPSIVKKIKKFIKFIKDKFDKNGSNNDDDDKNNTGGVVIDDCTTTETVQITRRESGNIVMQNNNIIIQELTYEQTVRTVVRHKKEIITDYDKKNFKRFNIR